jgi:hypothetical protein
MTVTQRLMAPGGFSFRLRTAADQFPDALAKQVGPFDQLVITPQRLEPITGFGDADILGSAIYAGVITGFPQPGEFTGLGLESLLGTPDGAGPNLETALVRSGGTLAQWAGDLFPANGIGVGTITTAGTTNVSGSYQWCTRREAWMSVCKLAGAEYRVRPTMTIDAGPAASLFAATPRVVVTRKAEGFEGAFQGLEGSMLQMSMDFEQYTTRAVVVGQGTAGNVQTGASQITSPFTGPDGQPIVMTRFVDSPTDSATNAINLAGSVLDDYSSGRRELKLSSRTYTVGRFVTPGDWIYAYDQVGGLSEPTNQITYRGELITPLLLRVYAITWPIEDGMGVYVRRRVGGTVSYVDLTDWVDWEASSSNPGDVQWEVGAASRPADPEGDRGVGTLGVNPEIMARTGAVEPWAPLALTSPWVDYGFSWIGAGIRRVGDMVELRGLVAGGTSGTTIATLPIGFRPPGDLVMTTACDVGGGNVFARIDARASGAVIAFFPPGTASYVSLNLVFSVA